MALYTGPKYVAMNTTNTSNKLRIVYDFIILRTYIDKTQREFLAYKNTKYVTLFNETHFYILWAKSASNPPTLLI